ncbi:MAG: hypothetical protein ACLQOO_34105 [Terriglobia bacterium]
MPNTAHIYRAKSGNWNISFNHPIVREGTIGRKIHRGLKVSDEQEAQRRRKEVDELLALAEKGPSAIPPRNLAEKKYSDVVVSAFYDCMNPEPVDYMATRDRLMSLPKGLPKVQVVGATGVGKTRLTQHLLQTTQENFPMRGAGRMTVADTEIIVDDADYEAAMTFYSENEIREVLEENIKEACEFAHANPSDTAKIAAKLLIDPDKRFRLNFVLGNVPPAAETTEIDDEDVEPEERVDSFVETTTHTSDAKKLDTERIQKYVARIIQMAQRGHQKAREDLLPRTPEDNLVVEEYWLKYVDETETNSLVEEILDVLTERLCSATGSVRWPVSHRVAKTNDRGVFFRDLLPFYHNHRKFFGSLVTPLVQGIRVRGRFYPMGLIKNPAVAWVLQDGQGLGHEQESATRQSGTVPPEISRKFEAADVICLVERAVPPMISGTPAPLLLSELVTRGHIDKLIMVFTHFEAVKAPDLDEPARKAKVLESVAGVVHSLDCLPKAQRIKLETTLESKAYFLARLDKDSVGAGSRGTRSEFQRLCDRLTSSAAPTYTRRQPRYNEYRVAEAVSREISRFREDWGSEALSSYHWKVMQALTNWIGNAYSDGYPGRNLYPGQDLARRVIAAISAELENPQDWTSRPSNADEESAILNAIRIQVSRRIDDLCRRYVIQEARTPDWLPAYREISGPGTKRIRATRVARILEDRACLPEEGLGEFVKEIWGLVLKGIDAALDEHAAETTS